MSVYNISSVIELYALCDYGERKDIYWETYVALCNAFGLPLDWEKQHEKRRAEKNSIIYKRYRRTFQEPFVQMHGELCYGDDRPFGVRMFQLRAEILDLLQEKLLEMDKLFFKEVFGIDTEKTFTECWWRSKSAKSGGGGSLQNGFWTHHSPGDPLEKRRDSPYR